MAHARILSMLAVCMGVMAMLSGLVLAAGLAGPLLGMRADVLDGSPFDGLHIPGLILAVAVGGSQLTAAWQNPGARIGRRWPPEVRASC